MRPDVVERKALELGRPGQLDAAHVAHDVAEERLADRHQLFAQLPDAPACGFVPVDSGTVEVAHDDFPEPLSQRVQPVRVAPADGVA
jgi:hypothetical protein